MKLWFEIKLNMLSEVDEAKNALSSFLLQYFIVPINQLKNNKKRERLYNSANIIIQIFQSLIVKKKSGGI